MARSIFEYRPKLRRDPREIETPASYLKDRVDPADQEASDEQAVGQEALVIDHMFDTIQDILDEQTRDLQLKIDGSKYPSLLKAIKAFGGSDTITRDIWKRALRVLENSVGASLGYDPASLAFAGKTEEGLTIPAGDGLVARNCVEAADWDYQQKYQEGEQPPDVPIDSLAEQKQEQTELNLLLLLWYNILLFLIDWFISILQKLAKGFLKSPIKRLIRKLEKSKKKICRKVEEMAPGASRGRCQQQDTKRIKYQVKSIYDLYHPSATTISERSFSWWDDQYELQWANVKWGDEDEEPKKIQELLDSDQQDIVLPFGELEVLEENLEAGRYPQLIPVAGGGLPPEDTPGSKTNAPYITIPPQCVKNAHAVVEKVKNWAIRSGQNGGQVNPTAFLIQPMVNRALDNFEAGKNVYTLNFDNKEADALRDKTRARPVQRHRWANTNAERYRSMILGK